MHDDFGAPLELIVGIYSRPSEGDQGLSLCQFGPLGWCDLRNRMILPMSREDILHRREFSYGCHQPKGLDRRGDLHGT
jgi:hypothetical protein